MQLNIKIKKTQITKEAKDLNSHFCKEYVDSQKAHGKMPNITRNEIKTIMRYHHPLVRMTIIKMCTNSKFWKGCGEM